MVSTRFDTDHQQVEFILSEFQNCRTQSKTAPVLIRILGRECQGPMWGTNYLNTWQIKRANFWSYLTFWDFGFSLTSDQNIISMSVELNLTYDFKKLKTASFMSVYIEYIWTIISALWMFVILMHSLYNCRN